MFKEEEVTELRLTNVLPVEADRHEYIKLPVL